MSASGTEVPDRPADRPGRAVLPAWERRAELRYRARGEVASQLSRPRAVESVWARVVDASAKGLGLEISRPLPTGTAVTVDVHGLGRRCRLLAWVVRADPTPGGSWLLGCRLLNELPEADLWLLCPRARRAGGDDTDA